MTQTKKDLEEFYKVEDPWKIQTNKDDIKRKQEILGALGDRWFRKALDIGCGEGWITKDLPADTIHGVELSNRAAKRIPKPAQRILEPIGRYDLILVAGVLYEQYDWQGIMSMIFTYAHPICTLVTCHIKSWEQSLPFLEPKFEKEFPYRQYTQSLKVYELRA